MIGRHLFIPLERGNKDFYASCNILNDDGLIYVYLLQPARGSLLFTLYFNEEAGEYQSRYIVPGLDKASISLINESLSEHNIECDLSIYSDRYKLIENQEGYEYFVINRIFESKEKIVKPTNRFHIFHETWNAFNEYEWESGSGFIVKKGEELTLEKSKIIETAIREM